MSETSSPRGGGAVGFIEAQGEALWQELARGRGERLAVLAVLAGCPSGMSGRFGLAMQARFARIVPDAEVAAAAMWEQVWAAVSGDESLAAVCATGT